MQRKFRKKSDKFRRWMEYLQIYKKEHMYTANISSVRQLKKSAKMSKAAFSCIAEKMRCALRFACCTTVSTRRTALSFSLWQNWCYFWVGTILQAPVNKVCFHLLLIRLPCNLDLDGLARCLRITAAGKGGSADHSKLVPTKSSCLVNKKRKERLQRIKKTWTAFVSFQLKTQPRLFPWVQLFKAERKPF